MKILIFLSVLFVFVSCGKDSNIIPKKQIVQKIEPAEEEEFSYEMTGINCTTGEHFFGSHKEACDGLLDDSLNNNCAENKRMQLYENEQCSA